VHITFDVDITEVEQAWNEALNKVSDGITRGVRMGVDEGVAEAKSRHEFKTGSGELASSIRGHVEVATRGGAVGVIEATAKHASYVEYGTQPHEIRPKVGEGFKGPMRRGQSRRDKYDIGTTRVALRWTTNGTVHFARVVHHPGSRPYAFMGLALQKAERVLLREVEVSVAEAQKIMERD